MSIELKHLSPYLPYKLNVGKHFENEFFQEEMDVSIMNSLFNDARKKPILRPLSDLSKKQVNELKKICGSFEFDNNYWQLDKIYFETPDYSVDIEFQQILDITTKLFEWHFDVFGLIPKELAIDINTINK